MTCWTLSHTHTNTHKDVDICVCVYVLCIHSMRNNNILRPSLASEILLYRTQKPGTTWEQYTHINTPYYLHATYYTHVITSKWKCVQHVQSKPKYIHGHSGLCKACNSPFLIIPIHFFLFLPWHSFNQIDWRPYALSQNRVLLNVQENTWANWIAKIHSARSLLKQAPHTHTHKHQNRQ